MTRMQLSSLNSGRIWLQEQDLEGIKKKKNSHKEPQIILKILVMILLVSGMLTI